MLEAVGKPARSLSASAAQALPFELGVTKIAIRLMMILFLCAHIGE
jgi:hypothetical protein